VVWDSKLVGLVQDCVEQRPLVSDKVRICFVWVAPCQHLEHEQAQVVVVDGAAVFLLLEDLRS